MMTHTPGKVKAEDLELVDSTGRSILNHPLEQCIANVKHAADCWNACEGLNPKAVPRAISTLKEMTRLIDAHLENESYSTFLEVVNDRLKYAITDLEEES